MKKEHERSLPLALPDDYLLPYGTELTPSSFTKTMDNTYIVDALDSHGNPAHYEIAVNGNLAKCTIDGKQHLTRIRTHIEIPGRKPRSLIGSTGSHPRTLQGTVILIATFTVGKP